jgi:alpha-tubulin suppressor-like RCC1 family protein
MVPHPTTPARCLTVLLALLLSATACQDDPFPSGPEAPPARVTEALTASAAPAFVQVSPGGAHTCGLTAAGVIWCWGNNATGQLGDGTTTNRLTPVVVRAGALRFHHVTAADYHTCALTTDARAYCWGDNSYGQLGLGGPTTRRLRPSPVSGGLTFRQLSAGGLGHTCGVTSTGRAYCWGNNQFGQLGDGTETDRSAPTPVASTLAFSEVLPGANFTCGTTTGGTAWCWGYNAFGQLGDGTTAPRLTPVRVLGGLTFRHVSAGDHTCGVTTASRAYCWGSNFNGELGDGTTTERHQPRAVAGGLTFTGVAAAGSTSCGITPGGRVYCWGNNFYGRVGDGTTTNRLTPTATAGNHLFERVNNGGVHACAVTSDGRTFCWGGNYAGQLGDGTTTERHVPTRVVGG